MECKLRDFQKLIALEARYHANCQTCWIVKHIHTMCMMNHLKNWLMPFRVGKRDCLQMNKILLIYPSRKKDEEAIKYTSHKVKPLRVIESHCSEFIVFYHNTRAYLRQKSTWYWNWMGYLIGHDRYKDQSWEYSFPFGSDYMITISKQ